MTRRIGCALLLATLRLAARDLVRIPAQEYDAVDERTGVKTHVRVDAFRIAPAETTQEEYLAIAGANPSMRQEPNLPVQNVSWWDAIRYCNARSVKEHLEPCYDLASGRCDRNRNGYRLPTETEWVVAAADHASPPSGTLSQIARLGLSDATRLPVLLARVKEGPAPVAGLAPNRFGLYDMLGNVWEWCQDLFDAVRSYPPDLGTDGPAPGRARVIRGGSYVTLPSWSKNFRSSMDPDARSPFTGFRVCRRDSPESLGAPVQDTASWTEVYHRAPPGYETGTGTLTNLLQTSAGPIRNADEWRSRLPELRKKWDSMLGVCQAEVRAPALRVLRRTRESGYTGTLAELEVEPGGRERIYFMEPDRPAHRPMPVVIVPYYDVDTPAGQNLGGRNYISPSVRSFALMAVQQGYLAVAMRWFGEGDGESYAEAVANLQGRHPGCTGFGKWVADARALVNHLTARRTWTRHGSRSSVIR
jgi:formylglycine-generating enzyme required for sulfatase activity